MALVFDTASLSRLATSCPVAAWSAAHSLSRAARRASMAANCAWGAYFFRLTLALGFFVDKSDSFRISRSAGRISPPIYKWPSLLPNYFFLKKQTVHKSRNRRHTPLSARESVPQETRRASIPSHCKGESRCFPNHISQG